MAGGRRCGLRFANAGPPAASARVAGEAAALEPLPLINEERDTDEATDACGDGRYDACDGEGVDNGMEAGRELSELSNRGGRWRLRGGGGRSAPSSAECSPDVALTRY
jgi:hypothetical protein